MPASIALALTGAMLYAVSAALQQRAAQRGVQVAGGWMLLSLLRRLYRDPMWRLGWVVNVAGFAAQALALHLGSIAVVQALLVTQLLFALPMGRRPLRRDWAATAAVCTGLVVLLTVRGSVPQTATRRPIIWLIVITAAALIALLVSVSRSPALPGGAGAAAGAAAAGICFCLSAIFLVYAGDDAARRGVLAAVLDWPLLGLCVSTLLGLVLVQTAFARGSLPAAMTSMTIVDPVASWIAGTLLFDAQPVFGPRMVLGSVLAAILIITGVVTLAYSPTVREQHAGKPRTPAAQPRA